jgi:serine/threonine protein phosphatase PrpC
MTGVKGGYRIISYEYLSAEGRSVDGMVRDHNEDAMILLPAAGVFCVADGMGGAQAGEVASQKIVDLVERELAQYEDSADHDNLDAKKQLITQGILLANRAIRDYVVENRLTNSGSTAVTILFDAAQPTKAMVLHIGDSRAYRVRGAEVHRITTDHSLVEEANLKSDPQLSKMFGSVVTRAVGMDGHLNIEETLIDVQEGDVLLLCSDGLNNMVEDPDMGSIIQAHLPDISAGANALVAAANEAGGRDNISVVLIVVGSMPSPEIPIEDLKKTSFDFPEIPVDEGDNKSAVTLPVRKLRKSSPAVEESDKPGGFCCSTPILLFIFCLGLLVGLYFLAKYLFGF